MRLDSTFCCKGDNYNMNVDPVFVVVIKLDEYYVYDFFFDS